MSSCSNGRGFRAEKPCAGWITPGVVSALDLDLDEYARGRTLQPIRGFETGVLGGRRLVSRLRLDDQPRDPALGVRRLPAHTRRSSVVQEVPVTRARESRDRWLVNGTFEAPMLVGAGGHFCPVARQLNPSCPEASLVAAQEIEVRVGAARPDRRPVDGRVPELYFAATCAATAGWCGRASISTWGSAPGSARARVCVAPVPAGTPHGGTRAERLSRAWPGHAYLLYGVPQRRVHEDGVLPDR